MSSYNTLEARLDAFLAKLKAAVLDKADPKGRRMEVHAVVVVEGNQISKSSHLLTKDFPLETTS